MPDYVTIHEEQWALADVSEVIAWCAKQTWILTAYKNPDDHAHCVICYWTIGVSTDSSIGMAYLTVGHHWLCQECYSKFISARD